MSLLDRIIEANRHDLKHFVPFEVAGVRYGYVKRPFAAELVRWPGVFQVSPDRVCTAAALDRDRDPVAARTAAVAEVLATLRGEGRVPGWRDEHYPVCLDFHTPPVFTMERAAVPMFGVTGYGVHLNGLVHTCGETRMWIGRRAMHKPTGPGKLDQMVAGGQPAGLGLIENMRKECAEEAAIPDSLAQSLRPVGAISYCLETDLGLRPDVIYCFDLVLPEDFEPRPLDGEVEAFYCWPLARVHETLQDTDAFKFNCALVAMDCLIRLGEIAPERPGYLELIRGLRAGAVGT